MRVNDAAMSRSKYSHGIYFAVDADGNRVSIDEAVRHGKGYFCELCHSRLNPRKGEVRIHHYAHAKGKSCDPWAQPMSEWHRKWQKCFPKESREIILVKNGEVHRADVYLETARTVIEFQHSPLSYEDFIERNDFYTADGRSVIWLFDVSKAFKDGHIDVTKSDEYGYYHTGCVPKDWNEANKIIWRWAFTALRWRTAQSLDRERVKVFLQLGEQSESMPWPIAEVTTSKESFKECVVTFHTVEDFVDLMMREQIYEAAPINEFQQKLLSNHPEQYSAKIWPHHQSSIVLLRKQRERQLTAVIGNGDAAVRIILERLSRLRELYDTVDVIIDLQGWTSNRHLISEPIECKDYTGDFYRGRNNPYLVLKLKDGMRGYLKLPISLAELVRAGRWQSAPRLRLWACVRWETRVPTSLTWVPEGAHDEWCWPFVPVKGSYVSLVTGFDGDSRIILDARWTFPFDTFLDDASNGIERYIKACKFDKRVHEPPFVTERARNKVRRVFGMSS
jgi:hypothetical protein